MPENYNYLFQYLEKEEITIDKKEFEFQVQSHPDYPSLIAITDTLHFFNIENGVLRVSNTEIELLPNRFIAFLKNDKNEVEEYFVEKKGIYYYCTKNKNIEILDNDMLIACWSDIVLLVEKSEMEQINNKKNHSNWFLFIIILGFFGATLFWFHLDWHSSLFFIFPILGVLFSVAALKDLFGTKSELLNKFCNLTNTTSCSAIVGSNKWAVFKYFNFSDLSLVFFSSQLFGLFLFQLSGTTTAFFGIQQLLLLASVTVILLSLYYQKFVEKKWCPICLVIIGIVLLELVYLVCYVPIVFVLSLQSLILFGFVFFSTTQVWYLLKKQLTQQKELKEFQLKGNRFMRNYEVFKNTLIASTPIENTPVQSGNILLGNVDASLKLTVITSPFCGYCNEAHSIIEEILQNHYDTICFDIRFNFNPENSEEKSKKIHQQLVAIYYEQGQEAFIKVLNNWFKNKDEKKLNIILIDKENESKINSILEEQFNWNQKNELSYTPAIIINQFIFPKQYERTELIHFINELSDDEEFYR
jgi:protein-disulfide isomerase